VGHRGGSVCGSVCGSVRGSKQIQQSAKKSTKKSTNKNIPPTVLEESSASDSESSASDTESSAGGSVPSDPADDLSAVGKGLTRWWWMHLSEDVVDLVRSTLKVLLCSVLSSVEIATVMSFVAQNCNYWCS
jgi:hypothetical protein